jgi:two-component system sensor histidine kinase UhpB
MTTASDPALPPRGLVDGVLQPGAAGEPAGTDAGDDRVRRELARELHDQVVQELTSTLIDLENFKRHPYDERAVADQVDQVQGSLRRTLGELREMLYRLRDEEAWQPTFTASLRDFAERYGERTGIRISVVADGDWPLSIRSAAANQLLRIVNEAVNNARLHGGARSVRVSLLADADQARVTILDDGRGLDPYYAEGAGLGILGMRERALLLGGSITVERAPEQGTLVRVAFPRTALS